MDEPINGSFNVTFFEVLLLQIPCVNGIINNFRIVFVGLKHAKHSLCSTKQPDRNILIEIK